MHIPCSSVFPLEIYWMIIRECDNPRPSEPLYFDDWRRRVGTLSRCSLTCWGWHQYAQPYLFHTIYARTNDWCYRNICKLAAIIREKPQLGRLVKSLFIDGREGDPRWIAVTLHGRWFPNLVALTVLSGRANANGDLTSRSFYKFLASYRCVQQLHLTHMLHYYAREHEKIFLFHALTPLTKITHLEVTCDAPKSMMHHIPNQSGGNILRSLIVFGGSQQPAIDDIMIPILKKGNVSLENLEFLYARSFYILRGVRDLIRRCSGSLRELHLVSAISSNPSTTLYLSPDDISLSSLCGIRRLYCESLALPDIIHILSTLPRPSTLTHLQLSISFHNLDVDNVAWRDLDAMLTSPAFPALYCLRFDLWYVPEDEFVRNLKAEKGWLRGCFGRGIVRYGGDYESFNDMKRRWGFVDV